MRISIDANPDALEHAILALLARRADGATICPAEAARAAGGSEWRGLMDGIRDAAWRLEAAGRVVVLQGGQPVRREKARGPIRIGLAVRPAAP